MASSSCSSATKFRSKHHVFLSFRGEDTRVGFTSHLHAELKRKNIQTFIDDDLKRGEEISDSLIKAIEGTMLSVIIFSQNYASSKWCLDELVKILECRKIRGQIVIPVFYQVDPSDVRKQSGSFGDAFKELVKTKALQTDKQMCFRSALNEAANISGHDSRNIGSEWTFIEEIVKDIYNKLCKMFPIEPKNLVGIDKRIEKIESLLEMESQDVRFVGIWGMGGIGKTTITGAVYNKICTEFEASLFIANVREELKRHTVVDLQRSYVSRLLDQEIQDMGPLRFGNHFIKDGLQQKKILIVLDDVDSSMTLKELLPGEHDSFGSGSRILVTSRDRHVLNQVVDATYEVETLNKIEALQLFKSNAFKKTDPTSYHEDLLEKMVDYAKGNPLALVVWGSALCDRSKEDWYSALNGLGQIKKVEIEHVLKISYDGLNKEEKDVFLDIAHFFRGMDRYHVTTILEKKSSSVRYTISVLIDKSLITASYNTLKMHDLLQEMAYSIVREESENPRKRSRLVDHEDIYDVLMERKETKLVKGICLDMSKSTEMQLESDAFRGMNHLEFLKFYDPRKINKVQFRNGVLKCLPNKLRYFHWDGYPLQSLPQNLSGKNLVELDLFGSKVVKLWSGQQDLANLRRINLRESDCLTELPDLSKANRLQYVNLMYCTSLTEVPSYFEYFEILENLCLYLCISLKYFPKRIGSKNLESLSLAHCSNIKKSPEVSADIKHLDLSGTAIEVFQQSFVNNKAKSKMLFLSDCSNITKFPEISGNLASLNLSGTSIEEVPSSICHLTDLITLRFNNCKKLSRLPNSICKLKSLESLKMRGCSKLEDFPEIMEPMESLTTLDLSETAIEELHSSIQFLTNLKQLRMGNCKKLSRLPSSICELKALEELDLRYTAIRELPSSIMLLKSLKKLHLDGTLIKELSELPPSMEILTANDCESLQITSTKTLGDSLIQLMFAGCSKFDHKALVEEMPLKIQFGKVNKEYGFQMVLPGSEIPEWFSDQSMGSSITIRFPSRPHHQLKAIAFCLVFVVDPYDLHDLYDPHNPVYTSSSPVQFSKDPLIMWHWRAKSNNCEHVGSSHKSLSTSVRTLKIYEKDHMHLCCYNKWNGDFSKHLGQDITFELWLDVGHCNELRAYLNGKRCGVHLVFDENTDQPIISGEAN